MSLATTKGTLMVCDGTRLLPSTFRHTVKMVPKSRLAQRSINVANPTDCPRFLAQSSSRLQPEPLSCRPTFRCQVLLTSLDRMLDTALELDTGRYSPAQSPLILYVVRLVVRVEGFLLFLRDDHRCRKTRGLRREDR